MLLTDAIKKAEEDEYVKKLVSEGYFLCSGFTSLKQGKISEWILHFYSPKNKKVVDCFVGEPDLSVVLGEETPAIKEMQKLDIKSIKISSEKALDIAKQEFKKTASSTLITLHTKEKTLWTVNMITLDMNVHSFDIDSVSGKILDKKTVSLIKTFDTDSKYDNKS